jgi:hypothetical protein
MAEFRRLIRSGKASCVTSRSDEPGPTSIVESTANETSAENYLKVRCPVKGLVRGDNLSVKMRFNAQTLGYTISHIPNRSGCWKYIDIQPVKCLSDGGIGHKNATSL